MLKSSRSIAFVIPVFACALFSTAHAGQPYPEDTVVASRGTATVTMLDVDAALIGVPPAQRGNFMNSPKRIEELVDRLLINKQMAFEARADKLDQNAVYKRAVDQQGDRILTEQLVQKRRADMDIGDVEQLARERYQINPDSYSIPGHTEVRHILINVSDRSDEEAKTLAESVRAKAIAGEDFVGLVKKYSDDRSKDSNEGLIPDGESDGLVPEFISGVKGLKTKGEISPLIKTSFGYHIIKLVDRYPTRPQSFDRVKDRIITQLSNSIRDARMKEHVDQLKGMELKATPEIVESLRTRYITGESSPAVEVPGVK